MYRDFGRPIELLLVEDNSGDALLFREGLREANAVYHLHIAGNGEEALQFLKRRGAYQNAVHPDLILLDLNLPGLSGHEVLSVIKADTSLRLIPVVVLTSSRAAIDVANAYAHGANSYLQKPTSLEETLDLVRTIEHYWLHLALLPSCVPR